MVIIIINLYAQVEEGKGSREMRQISRDLKCKECLKSDVEVLLCMRRRIWRHLKLLRLMSNARIMIKNR